MLTIILFLVLLSVLILVHEFGHFIAAKKLGVVVEEFGLGLPPRAKTLFTWKGTKFSLNWVPWRGGFVKIRGFEGAASDNREEGTIFSLNWLPIGGFVRMRGESPSDSPTTDYRLPTTDQTHGAFYAQKAWKRAVILLAGVVMNFVLAVVLFTAVYQVIGIPTKTEDVVIGGVAPGSPAERSSLHDGDIVSEAQATGDRLQVTSTDEFVQFINDHRGEEITLLIERDGERMDISVVPRTAEGTPEGEGALGVAISNVKFLRYPWWQMPVRSAITGTKEAFGWGATILTSLRDMVKSLVLYGQVPKDVAGPIGIARLTGHVAQQGWLAFLQFAGVLSINLAILNALPIPALDGGRLAFLGIEVLRRGRPIDPKTEHRIHLAGYAVLIALIILVSVRDVVAPINP